MIATKRASSLGLGRNKNYEELARRLAVVAGEQASGRVFVDGVKSKQAHTLVASTIPYRLSSAVLALPLRRLLFSSPLRRQPDDSARRLRSTNEPVALMSRDLIHKRGVRI
jgi:hypothetical protein